MVTSATATTRAPPAPVKRLNEIPVLCTISTLTAPKTVSGRWADECTTTALRSWSAKTTAAAAKGAHRQASLSSRRGNLVNLPDLAVTHGTGGLFDLARTAAVGPDDDQRVRGPALFTVSESRHRPSLGAGSSRGAVPPSVRAHVLVCVGHSHR